MIRSKRETAETERALEKQAKMFIEGYVLVKDTFYKGLWKASFMLKEF